MLHFNCCAKDGTEQELSQNKTTKSLRYKKMLLLIRFLQKIPLKNHSGVVQWDLAFLLCRRYWFPGSSFTSCAESLFLLGDMIFFQFIIQNSDQLLVFFLCIFPTITPFEYSTDCSFESKNGIFGVDVSRPVFTCSKKFSTQSKAKD